MSYIVCSTEHVVEEDILDIDGKVLTGKFEKHISTFSLKQKSVLMSVPLINPQTYFYSKPHFQLCTPNGNARE